MQNTMAASAEQILSALQQIQTGVPTYTIMVRCGITEETLVIWKKRYQNMSYDQLQRIWLLEIENAALHRLVNSLAMDDDQINEGILTPSAHVTFSV